VGNPAEETCCYPNEAMLHSRNTLSTSRQSRQRPNLNLVRNRNRQKSGIKIRITIEIRRP